MKKIIISLVCVVVVIMFVSINKYNNYKFEFEQKENEVEDYLEQNFDEAMEITDISIKDGCYAVCSPLNDNDFKFEVMYWASREKYIDTYLQRCLENEADQIFLKELNDPNLRISCNTQLLTGSPINKYEELQNARDQLGRPLSWYDDICEEVLQEVSIIVYDDGIDINTANEMAEQIKKLPIPCQHIRISKNKLENVLADIYS